MTKKSTLFALALLLIAGVGAVLLINRSDRPDPQPEPVSQRPGRPDSAVTNSGEPSAGSRSKPRSRDSVANAELVARYGEARTNLSKHVATTVVALLEDAISMGEMAATGGMPAGFGGRRGVAQAGLGPLANELDLTDEQRAQAEALYADFQKREIARAKAATESLRQDPAALMQVMLASDAFSRGEMSEAEYKAIQASAQSELEGVMNPLDRRNFQGGRPLQDDAFQEGMLDVLDPAQAETFQSALAEQTDEDAERGSITEMPAMDLEQLDKTVTAAKTLTSGARQMMEGLGNLQELGPMLEEQRRRQRERDGE